MKKAVLFTLLLTATIVSARFVPSPYEELLGDSLFAGRILVLSSEIREIEGLSLFNHCGVVNEARVLATYIGTYKPGEMVTFSSENMRPGTEYFVSLYKGEKLVSDHHRLDENILACEKTLTELKANWLATIEFLRPIFECEESDSKKCKKTDYWVETTYLMEFPEEFDKKDIGEGSYRMNWSDISNYIRKKTEPNKALQPTAESGG